MLKLLFYITSVWEDKHLANAAVYYQLTHEETIEQAIENVNKLIHCLESRYVIRGVFLDSFNERSELHELINSYIPKIDILYLNKPISDDFDHQLIYELARTDKFEIKYFFE
jgi:hypothetical protein